MIRQMGIKDLGLARFHLKMCHRLFLDVEEGTAIVDVGAMHARSDVERGIKFTTDRADSEGGKNYWLIWVTIDHKEAWPLFCGCNCV